MKNIRAGLPMYAYWPGCVFVHVGGIEVLAYAVVRVWCVCACGVCARAVCVQITSNN